jgi:hypothetical protein
MKSERRDTPRIPVTLEVMFNPDNAGFRRGVTLNISLDGALVDTGSARIPRRSRVELAIKIRTAGKMRIHRFHAQTVHAGPDGVGLAFDRVSTEGYSALFDLVYAQQPHGGW